MAGKWIKAESVWLSLINISLYPTDAPCFEYLFIFLIHGTNYHDEKITIVSSTAVLPLIETRTPSYVLFSPWLPINILPDWHESKPFLLLYFFFLSRFSQIHTKFQSIPGSLGKSFFFFFGKGFVCWRRLMESRRYDHRDIFRSWSAISSVPRIPD